MTNYTVKDIDEYITNALPEARPHLEKLREVVESAIQEAEGGIHYGKPYYKYHGKYVAGFDVYKNHIGFEIWADQLAAEDRKTLEEKGYKTGSRTFQIQYNQKVPTTIITKMIKRTTAGIDRGS